MKSLWSRAAFLVVLFAFPVAFAQATIRVNPMSINVDGKKRVHNIKVTNTGKTKEYIHVTVSMVEHAGRPDEHHTLEPNPKKSGLVATPSKFVLSPGGTRYVRVAMTRKRGEKDRIYLVNVLPIGRAFSTTHTGARLMVGYGVRVRVRAAHLQPYITVSRQADRIVLKNRGNTHVLLSNIRSCVAVQGKPQQERCDPFPVQRYDLYADASWTVPLSHDVILRLTKQYPGYRKEVQISN